MKTGKTTTAVLNFLAQDVPPSGTSAWKEWASKCQALGASATKTFLQKLKTGNENEQYAALLALRIHGYEAYGRGHGAKLYYSVKKGDKTKRIQPQTRRPVSA